MFILFFKYRRPADLLHAHDPVIWYSRQACVEQDSELTDNGKRQTISCSKNTSATEFISMELNLLLLQYNAPSFQLTFEIFRMLVCFSEIEVVYICLF